MKPFAILAALAAIGINVWQWRTAGPEQALVHVMYQSQSFEQMARGANAVLAGRVTAVSETRWNQDDGTFWDTTDADGQTQAGLPYYEVTLQVADPIVDTTTQGIAARREVVLTVVGMNPADEAAIAEQVGIASADHGPEGLQVGQDIVVFAQQSEIAWRDGEARPILQLMGHPEQAYFRTGRRGLESSAAGAPSGTLAEVKGQILALRGATD